MSHDEQGKSLQAVVKNTFIHTIDLEEEAEKTSLRRSASDSDIGLSSSNEQEGSKFWLGSKSSQSTSSSAQSKQMHSALSVSQSSSSGVPASAASAGGDELIQRLHNELQVPIAELMDMDAQGLLRQIPRNCEGEMSSVGSILHASGECSPCIFWFRKCCSKGIHCSYCHFRHHGQRNKRIRPSKKTRQQMRDTRTQKSSNTGDSDTEERSLDNQSATSNNSTSQTQGRGLPMSRPPGPLPPTSTEEKQPPYHPAGAPEPEELLLPPDSRSPLSAAFGWLTGPARRSAPDAPARGMRPIFGGSTKTSL